MTQALIKDVLLVAFGGPEPGCCKRFETCPGEAYCFVSGIFGHVESRKARIEEVAAHYRHLGGFSNFNEHTRRQAKALQSELARRGRDMRVHVGFHHWAPYVRDVLKGMASEGRGDFVVIVMAPHQSSVSWDRYLRIVGEGVELLGDDAPQIAAVAEPFSASEGFIAAIADRIKAAAARSAVDLTSPTTALLFSAHSVPQPVAKTSPYCRQFEETARLACEALGISQHTICYQSQPGDSNIPWTGPSPEAAIADLAKAGKRTIIAMAIGFLCDNVEVLYDLGVEGKQAADEHGVGFIVAESVHDHPAFIAELANRVESAVQPA